MKTFTDWSWTWNEFFQTSIVFRPHLAGLMIHYQATVKDQNKLKEIETGQTGDMAERKIFKLLHNWACKSHEGRSRNKFDLKILPEKFSQKL